MKHLIFFILFLSSFFSFSQDSLLQKGQQYLELGRNDLALETLIKAENSLRNTNDLTAAECYNNLGVVYYNNGNDQTALDYLEKGMKIREAQLDATSRILADSYINMGLLYLEDDFLQAIIYFDKALDIYLEVFDENHPKIAFCYTNMAFAHRFQGNYQDALAYMDLTMEIWNNSTSGDHPSKALTLSNKATIYQQQGAYKEALTLQQQALDQYIRLYGLKHPEVANTYSLVGSIQSDMRQYKEAVSSFQQSIYANLYDQDYVSIYNIPEIRNYYNSEYLLSSLRAKAQAMEALHFEHSLRPRDIEAALATYQKCDELIMQIRQSRLNEKDKIRIGNIASSIYNNGIRIALYLADKTFQKTKYQEIAFTFCERSKSATLLEAINESRAKSFAGIPDRLIQLEDSLKAEISWLEKEVAGRGDNTDQNKAKLFDYQQAYRKFIDRLEIDYPAYFNLKYQQSDISSTQIRSMTPANTAVLSYFIGEESIFLFYLSKSDFKVYNYPKEDLFSRWTSGLRNSIKYDVPAGFDQSARKLYSQLIPPIGRAINQLIIIPDGVLGTIPFETLLVEEPTFLGYHYLIEDYAISYDYAATLLIDKLKSSTLDNGVSGIFLSAPVSFENNELRMPTLPGTEEEVGQIQKLFASAADAPTVRLNKEASESMLKTDELATYKYLHFATHGIVNESRPELSRIFLAPGQNEDGSLYSGEIYNLKINANLVTLSACETGLGKVEKGEGIIGLSRSLTYAGAKNLIVSLWQVADKSTAQLMIDFYTQHLLHSNNKIFADDLRRAKLSFIKGYEYSKPYYWAPFILIGQ